MLEISLFVFLQDASAIFVFPSGVEKTLHECIHRMKGCYGDQKGKQFRVWVDRVLSTPIGSNTWLVKFDKWELSGDSFFLIKIGSFLVDQFVIVFAFADTFSCKHAHIVCPIQKTSIMNM